MPPDVANRLLAVLGALVAIVPVGVSAELTERIEYRRAAAGADELPARVQPVAFGGTAPAPWLHGRALHAATVWDIRWSAPLQRRADGRCAVTRPTTLLSVVITLPVLSSDDPRALPRLQRQVDALQVHESGHLVIAQTTARRLDGGLLAIEPAADCAWLARAAERLADDAIKQGSRDQAAYDVLTDHGRQRQARLPAAPP